jgi:hypothetical protein
VYCVLRKTTRIGSHFRSAEGTTYQCRGPGALLSLPHGGRREDVIRTKVFHDYIRDNVVSWFDWSQKNGLGVERMEDLILVTGCTLVTSWAAIAFLGRTGTAEISLVQMPDRSERSFECNNIRGDVAQHSSGLGSVSFPCYIGSCTESLVMLEEKFRPDSESMRLHQGFPSKAPRVIDQTHPGYSGTPS